MQYVILAYSCTTHPEQQSAIFYPFSVIVDTLKLNTWKNWRNQNIEMSNWLLKTNSNGKIWKWSKGFGILKVKDM